MLCDIILLDLICEVYDCEFYCMDCDCFLCGDCVICDYVGYKVKKVF